MIRHIVRKTIGALLVLLGIAGLFLPFLQGFVLIFAGIFLLDERLYQSLKEKGKKAIRRAKATLKKK